MIKIDLITGFLGSGKTTFIRHYAKWLISQGKNIAILENDYGAINVDMMLLDDLQGDHCDVEMVVGGGDWDCHRRRFKSKLITLGMLGYDRVIVEPSGIYDVDEFFDVLNEDPIDQWYEIGSVISIVDARLEHELSDESDYLLTSQTCNAGRIVLSRTQIATQDQITDTMDHMKRAWKKFECNRQLTDGDILARDWEKLTDADYTSVMNAGYVLKDHVKEMVSHENAYDSFFYMDVHISPEQLKDRVEKLVHDEKAGNVIRVKGFVKDADGKWIELNATKEGVETAIVPKGQEVIIVIGEHLNRNVVNGYWNYKYGTSKTNVHEDGSDASHDQV